MLGGATGHAAQEGILLAPREEPVPEIRLAASGGLPESGNPGLSALLLSFWLLRLSYLVPLLPRPRRVR